MHYKIQSPFTILALLFLPSASQCLIPDPNPLISEIRRMEFQLRGTIGVYAINRKTSNSFGYRSDTYFPMASTRKIAITAKFLQMVDGGSINLSDSIRLSAKDWRPGSGLLNKKQLSGHAISWNELLRLTLEESDNVATDCITAKVGGPQAVTRWLKKQGIEGMNLDRDSLQIKKDYDAVNLPDAEATQPQAYLAAQKLVKPSALSFARKSFCRIRGIPPRQGPWPYYWRASRRIKSSAHLPQICCYTICS